MNTGFESTPAALDALLRRAESLKEHAGLAAPARQFWRGYVKGLRDLQSGGGTKAAAKDSASQHVRCMPQGNWAALVAALAVFVALPIALAALCVYGWSTP
jgi:hypothetical protein